MNFRVTLDGEPAEIEAVEFIDATQPRTFEPLDTDDGSITETPRARGRLIVLFFQTDFQRASSRVGGQMKMLEYAKEFVAAMKPHDRVAVVQFDSHLKVREDFTHDRERVMRAIEESLKIVEIGS